MEIAILVLLAVLFVLLAWNLLQQRRRWREQSEAFSRTLDEKMAGSLSVFGDLRERLGELATRTRSIEEVGRSISSLQEALRAPKFRGRIGETGLEVLLANILPPGAYSLQRPLRHGEVIVDAAIEIGGNLVPVDAKFPFSLEDFERMVTTDSDEERTRLRRQFTRTVKKHVDAVHKYILPDEGTFDFALMYIPAENIYYETIIRDPRGGDEDDLYSYCCQRRVFPVSPNTFYAYLQAIVLGLKGLNIERAAREIRASLARLQGDLRDFQQDFEVLGGHINRAAGKYGEAARKLARLDDRLRLAGEMPAEELPEGTAGPD